jgi:ATP-dependent Clp protease ATP-binding subunit ClpC
MSEYMEKHSVSKLIGAPPGYIGYEEGGQLTETVKRKPYCLILLDEIEKAHSDVFNILLQILEDGRLTDAKGKTVNFTNTIIIMTSNLGSRSLVLEGRLGFAGRSGQAVDAAEAREIVDREIRRHFPPEFVNRIDDVIVFGGLDATSMVEVARILLEETAANLGRKQVEIRFSPEVSNWLVEQCGMDPKAGARPMRRLIQRWVEDAVADHLINQSEPRAHRLEVRVEEGRPVVKLQDQLAHAVGRL